MKRTATPGTFRFIWGIPTLLAVLTMSGLLVSLLGTGIWHVFSWLALSVPIVVGLTCCLRRKSE